MGVWLVFIGKASRGRAFSPVSEILGFPVAQLVMNLPAMRETWVQPLGQEDSLEKGVTIPSSILAWRIPWTEDPGELQTMGGKESNTTE